ncbi:MAG: hypothetical protein ACHP6I_03550 [Rickettsiales bacterium]
MGVLEDMYGNKALKKQLEEARKQKSGEHTFDAIKALLALHNTKLNTLDCKAEILLYGLKLAPCLAFTKGDANYIAHDCAAIETPPDCLVSDTQ